MFYYDDTLTMKLHPQIYITALFAMVALFFSHKIHADQKPTEPGSFRVITHIGFGSCLDQHRPQPIWPALLKEPFDLFIFSGDVIYEDTTYIPDKQRAFKILGENPFFKKLISKVPILATWDDHDYGADNQGSEYSSKKEMKSVFLDFFGTPADSPRRKRDGIYGSYMLGPLEKRVQIILLDARYFKTPLRKKKPQMQTESMGSFEPEMEGTVLGEEQWSWLENELLKPAQIRVLVSSIQFIPNERKIEYWGNFPHERKRLLDLIQKTRAEGLVILSGDAHFAELSKTDEGGYPIYELTSSGLNQGDKIRSQTANARQIAAYAGENYGFVSIDWSHDPKILLGVKDTRGRTMIRQAIQLSELRFPENKTKQS